MQALNAETIVAIKRLSTRKGQLRHGRRWTAPVEPRRQPARRGGDIVNQMPTIYERTGLYPDEFENLYAQISARLVQARLPGQRLRVISTSLTPRMRLLLVLQFLKEHSPLKNFRREFAISSSQVSREISHSLPILAEALDEIRWPGDPLVHIPTGTIGAIDCTAHPRQRPHPGQARFYRGDKKCHFVSGQAVVTLGGVLISSDLVTGHNNDQGTLYLTGMNQQIILQNVRLLGDKGKLSQRLYLVRSDPLDRS
jgi:hypothetical protein